MSVIGNTSDNSFVFTCLLLYCKIFLLFCMHDGCSVCMTAVNGSSKDDIAKTPFEFVVLLQMPLTIYLCSYNYRAGCL